MLQGACHGYEFFIWTLFESCGSKLEENCADML